MGNLSTVRGMLPQLQEAGIDTLFLNIHEPPGSELLERFEFRFSPTYILWNASQNEVWRGNDVLNIAELSDLLAQEK